MLFTDDASAFAAESALENGGALLLLVSADALHRLLLASSVARTTDLARRHEKHIDRLNMTRVP